MTPETERLHQLNAELTAQRDEARAERDKITSDYNLLAIELIDAHTSLAQAAAERDKAQADVERLRGVLTAIRDAEVQWPSKAARYRDGEMFHEFAQRLQSTAAAGLDQPQAELACPDCGSTKGLLEADLEPGRYACRACVNDFDGPIRAAGLAEGRVGDGE